MRFWSPKNSQLRPFGAARLALLEEGAERRDAGARADHDRRRAVVGRRAETVALLHEDRDDIARLGEVGEVARADAGAGALVAVPAHGRHGEMHLARMRLGRRGDRVEARLQAIERLQQAGQRGHHRGKGHQEVEQVGVGQLGRPLAARQRLQLQRLLAVEGAGGQEHHALVAGAGDVDLAQKHLAQRQGLAVEGHHLLAGGADAIEHGLHELRVLAGEHAQAVACLVGEVGGRQVEHDVTHVLARTGSVERMGVDQGGERGPIARADRGRRLRHGSRRARRRAAVPARPKAPSACAGSPCRPARSGPCRPRRPTTRPRHRSGRDSRTGRNRAGPWRP